MAQGLSFPSVRLVLQAKRRGLVGRHQYPLPGVIPIVSNDQRDLRKFGVSLAHRLHL